MSALIGHALALVALLVVLAIIYSIIGLPRPAQACARCGARKSRVCWRVDCPSHDEQEAA